MIHRELNIHHGPDGDGILPVFVGNHHRRFAHRADREDGGFRRVNNGRKVSDAEHAQIGDGEGAVAVLLRLQAPLLGPRHQILGFGGHIGEALILYILYHRYHKAVVSGHGGTYIDGLVGDDLILFQRHVDSGELLQRLAGRHDQQIGNGDAHLAVLIELLAEGGEIGGVHRVGEVEVRRGKLGMGQLVADDLAHPLVGNHGGDLQFIGAGRSCRCGGPLHVLLHNLLSGAGNLYGTQIDAGFLGQLAGQGAGFDIPLGNPPLESGSLNGGHIGSGDAIVLHVLFGPGGELQLSHLCGGGGLLGRLIILIVIKVGLHLGVRHHGGHMAGQDGVGVLAGLAHHGHRSKHRHGIAGFQGDLQQSTGAACFHGDHRLVGVHVKEGVADGDRIPHLLVPLRDSALILGVAQLGHDHYFCHFASPLLTVASLQPPGWCFHWAPRVFPGRG